MPSFKHIMNQNQVETVKGTFNIYAQDEE